MEQQPCRKPEHDGVEGECYGCAREAERDGRCGNCYGAGRFYPDEGEEMYDPESGEYYMDYGGFPCTQCDGQGTRIAQLQKRLRRNLDKDPAHRRGVENELAALRHSEYVRDVERLEDLVRDAVGISHRLHSDLHDDTTGLRDRVEAVMQNLGLRVVDARMLNWPGYADKVQARAEEMHEP